MSQPDIHILTREHQPALERYLLSRPTTTMFLRGNLAAVGGLGGDPMIPYGGVYAGVVEGDAVTGVAAHFWNDNVIVEADAHQPALARALFAATDRGLKGLLGPAPQIGAIVEGLGLTVGKPDYHSAEILYALDLEDLRMPAALEDDTLEVRRGSEVDRAQRLEWRMAFMAEAFGTEDTPETRATAEESNMRGEKAGHSFVLYADGEPVSISGFNTAVPDCVQIGGVFTPPELRSRGYGRAVVAGSLALARETGVVRSVLFTENDNVAAQRAYEALGYAAVGDYALVFFNEGQRLD